MAGLREILDVTRERARALRPRRPELDRVAAGTPAPPSWTAAFGGDEIAVIAEVKRQSPSRGSIAPDLDPARLARAYVEGGAAAISVLTDGPHFGGSLDDLIAVRGAVDRPVLRKDFLIDPVQIIEARAAGASAVLLIVRALDDATLRELADLARSLGMARLVEVHTVEELERAGAVEPEAIGVNSRDLDSFRVSLEGIAALLAAVPARCIAVAESGIASRADVERVAAWGADAVLVGTAVAGAVDPAAAVRDLVGIARARRTPTPSGPGQGAA